MSIAIDTNVLVRLLTRDDAGQVAAARALLGSSVDEGEPVLVPLMCLLETEWVLRSRYRLDKASIALAFSGLLESGDVQIEDEVALEEALYQWTADSADFADYLLAARALRLGCTRFATFDIAASRLPGAELLA